MLDKIPPPIHDLLAPGWVWLLSMFGAGVSYLDDFRLEDSWKVWILKAMTKGSSSALAAVLTYHSLLAAKITDASVQVVLIGIASHMGTEAIKALGERWKGKA